MSCVFAKAITACEDKGRGILVVVLSNRPIQRLGGIRSVGSLIWTLTDQCLTSDVFFCPILVCFVDLF